MNKEIFINEYLFAKFDDKILKVIRDCGWDIANGNCELKLWRRI